jgi:hypothetical protein
MTNKLGGVLPADNFRCLLACKIDPLKIWVEVNVGEMQWPLQPVSERDFWIFEIISERRKESKTASKA